MKAILKMAAHALLGDYAFYHIYTWSWADGLLGDDLPGASWRIGMVDADALLASADDVIAHRAGFLGADSVGFACFEDDRIIGVCFYWFAERYRRRNFWPLGPGEAKLVEIVTIPGRRGRGVAARLIAVSSLAMVEGDFARLYARIWHSNGPSLRAFDRAGWHRIGTVVEVNPLRLRRSWRFVLKVRGLRARESAPRGAGAAREPIVRQALSSRSTAAWYDGEATR